MSARVEVVDPGVVRIVLPGRVSNAYLFLGTRIALVDCGSEESQRDLLEALRQLEIKRERISLVVLTHEHAGHAGGASAFPGALLVAHPLAAAKLRHGEEPLTKLQAARAPSSPTGARFVPAASRSTSCTRPVTRRARSACTSGRERSSSPETLSSRAARSRR